MLLNPHPSSIMNHLITDKESVGSNSSQTLPPPPSASLPTHPPLLAVAATMASPRQSTDKCFRCNEIGHWAQNCPNTTSRRPSPSKSPSDHGLPVIHCRCDAGPCPVRVASSKSQHPGWKFYCCPLSGVRDCKFFMWCKDVKKEDIVERPTCRCEAGRCRIEGKFYVCPIKKGQGACSFRIPLDAPNSQSDSTNTSLMSTVTECQETVEDPVLPDGHRDYHFRIPLDALNNQTDESYRSPVSTLTHCHEKGDNPALSDGDDNYLSDELLEAHLPELDGNISSPQSTVTNSGNSSPSDSDVVEDGDITHLRIQTDPHGSLNVEADQVTLDGPLRRHKRLRHGAPKDNGLTLGSAIKGQQLSIATVDSLAAEETITVSRRVTGLASGASVHLRQMEFWRDIALADDSSSLGVAADTSSIVCSSEAVQLPISPVPLSHNYLEATTLLQALGFKGWCGRVVHLPSQGLQFAQPKPTLSGVFPNLDPIDAPQLTCNELKGPAEAPPLKVSPGSKKPEKVSRFQNKIAMQLQNELLSELESTDFHEHEFLADEAAITYHLLEGLSVQYQPFKEIVDEFINKAKSLAEAEESVNSDKISFELVERQKCKKQKLDEVTRRHSETQVDLDTSNQHLEELEKEATRLRELLAHAEEILDCCKAENAVIRTRFDLISRDKWESEVSFEVASIEADAAVKIQQEKEAELDVAKAEFDKARSNLRQSCVTDLT